MKKAVAILVVLAVAIVAATLLRPLDEKRNAQTVTGLPWQIDILPDGTSKIFGLTLPTSTLRDAREHFGKDMEIAVIATPGEAGSLEAYYGQITLGVLTGKMILVAAVEKETVERMRQHARKSEYMEGSTRKFTLNPDDMELAYGARIGAITFIPSASFDEEIALRHFGQPGERVRTSGEVEHWLYPEKGLALTLDSGGKEILQYVAPRHFARLRDPLLNQTPR